MLALHFAAMRRISPPEACHVLPAASLRDASVIFWSARDGADLVGIGALKLLDKRHGEVKSMRVADAARGRGIGRALLDQILPKPAAAASAG